MKKQQAVYQLIHGLSEKEKSKIEELIMPDGTQEKLYQQLYYFFDNLPVYDEDQIRRASQEMGWDTSFHSTVKYLYDLLVVNLSRMDQSKDIEAQIYSHFKYARALKNRGFYELAIEEIKSALKLAREYEWSAMVNEAAILRIVQLLDTEEFKLSQSIKELLKMANDSVQRIQLGHRINHCYYELSDPIMDRRESLDKKNKLVEKIIAEWGPGRAIPDVDFLLIHRYCMLRYRCAVHQKQASEMRFWAEKCVELFSSNKARQNAHREKYILSLNQLNSCLYNLNDWEGLKVLIQQLKKMKGRNPGEQAEIFQVYCLAWIQYSLNQYKPEDIDLDELQSIAQKRQELGSLIRQNRRLKIIYMTGLIHFLRREYKKASPIWEDGVKIKRKLERVENIQQSILVLQLIVDFEESHLEIGSRAVSVRNRLLDWRKETPQAELSAVEGIIINAFRRLSSTYVLAERKKVILQQIKNEIMDYIHQQKKAKRSLENQLLGEILFWLNGHFPDIPDPRNI